MNGPDKTRRLILLFKDGKEVFKVLNVMNILAKHGK